MNKNKELENEVSEIYYPEVLPGKTTPGETLTDTPQEFFTVASGPPIIQATELMGTGKDNLERYIENKKAVSHSNKISIIPNNAEKKLTVRNEKTTKRGKQIIEITYNNLDLITTQGPAEKLFILLLSKVTTQALSYGELIRNYISFPLQELVDKHFYQNLNSAREGFKKLILQVMGIQIGGVLQEGKNKEPIDTAGYLFYHRDIDGGQCKVYLNEKFNWAFLGKVFTVFPQTYWAIPTSLPRAGKLFKYICLLTRQNLRRMKKDKVFSFTISFRAIYAHIGLPGKDTKNPSRDIIDAILETIKTVQKYAKGYFEIETIYNVNDSWRNQLEHGYIEVFPQNEYLKLLKEYALKVEKKIQKRIAAKEKRIEEAKTRNLQKSMEKEAKEKESKN